MQMGLFFLLPILFIPLAYAATVLQNPDFESPPSNLPEYSTAPFTPLTANNTIPGWTFDGTVQYVTAGPTIALPGNGHAIQLGQDGKINQTFTATSTMSYVLTFTLARDDQNCSANADILISAPDSRGAFSSKQHYGKETWESYGHYLGSWRDGEPINLVIQSQTSESDPNSTCWPIIDTLLLKSVATLEQGNNGNLLPNGGFESGPDFLSNSTEGILLDPVSSPIQSAIQQWSVLGTVKYIDSKHYFVPEGNAAIELVSGISSGIQAATTLTEGSAYDLDFTVGDANDSCVGTFVLGAQAGSTVENFTVQSEGTGSAKTFSMTFKADSSVTTVSFLSYTSSPTKDGVFCGPVVDNVTLKASYGLKLDVSSKITFCWLVSLLAILHFTLG